MSFPQPAPIKAFAELWTISEPGEFVYQLSRFISHKKSTRKAPLSPAEYTFQLLMDMQPTIEMEGFQDLFFQAYSLADCVLVESGLREIGAHQLADLFAALADHCRDGTVSCAHVFGLVRRSVA